MPRVPRDNASRFLSRIAPYVYSDGARNLNQISHDLGIPYPTVRFRMMRLKDLGIRVVPIVEVEKIGLERVRVSFELSDDPKDPRPFLGALHQAAGLRYYARSLVSQIFDCEFDIPGGSIGNFSKLLKALEEMGFIESVTIRRLVWKDFLTMRTEYFDYLNEEWDVNFSTLSGNPSTVSVPSFASGEEEQIKNNKEGRRNVSRVDHKDLLIIKSLQVDAWRTAVDIGNEIKVDPPDVMYHLNKHVFEKKLISSFKLKWAGAKGAWAKHRLVPATFVFEKLSDDIARHSMSVMTSAPFTWNHMMADDGTYIAELLIPIAYLTETMCFLSNGLRPLHSKPKVLYADPSCLSNYTIPYLMHDVKNGWSLSSEKALGYVLQMVKQYQSARSEEAGSSGKRGDA